eukprot:TRINITY_DN3729_c0_g1_i2.p1 TRINITY_DN3729_c0_g1~~TRINITY_DN3729_c0_g1_i2.p1  ORF type:complete len:365 (-),score=84.67 TRINITY_DN3729_c0_g1_i2:13-1107(-)
MDHKRGYDEYGDTSSESKRLKSCNKDIIDAECCMKKDEPIPGSSIAIADEKTKAIKNDDELHLSNMNKEEMKSDHGSIKEKILEESKISTVDKHDSNSSIDQAETARKITLVEADVAEDKGSRHTMEDAWVILIDGSTVSNGKLRCHHFAIYDGHGGRQAAEYARTHLHSNVMSSGLPCELMDIKAAKKAIIDGFRKTDENLLKESMAGGWQDGATAVCVWVLGQMVFVANIGDAKAVVARCAIDSEQRNSETANSPLKSIVVTREHKAIYPQERARIEKAGGFVGTNGRLQGRLEVSRAFGDRQFKKVGVSAIPDVHSFELTKREKFMVLGCDGLWGVVTSCFIESYGHIVMIMPANINGTLA